MYLFSIFILILSTSLDSTIADIFCWVPSVGIFRLTDYKFKEEGLYTVVNICTLVTSSALVYLLSRKNLKGISLLEKKVKDAEVPQPTKESSTEIE